MSPHDRKLYEQNRLAWDRMARGGSRFARTATDEECRTPLKTLDTRGWLPASVQGMDVLCLASGGGWQSVLYALAGANVTVVDLSPAMLQLDLREAARRHVTVRVVEASMDDLSMLNDQSFDIVHQPVSTCYVPDLAAVYREISRVTRDGGLYISQHKQPTSLQIEGRDPQNRYFLGVQYYHSGELPLVGDQSYRESGTSEYLHRWDDLIGELCRAGFVLEDLREPYRGDPNAPPGDYHHRGLYAAPYVRLKGRRIKREKTQPKNLWVP